MHKDYSTPSSVYLTIIHLLLAKHNLAYLIITQEVLVRLLHSSEFQKDGCMHIKSSELYYTKIPYEAKVLYFENGEVHNFTNLNDFKIMVFDRFSSKGESIPVEIKL